MTYLLADIWIFVVMLMLILAFYDAGYFYRGRHRGVYVEKPGWKPSTAWPSLIDIKPDTHEVAFIGQVLIRDYLPDNVAVLTIEPPGGLLNIPCLFPDKEGDGERFGEFGDVTIDRADSAPLCDPTPSGIFNSTRTSFWDDEWRLIGTLDTEE